MYQPKYNPNYIVPNLLKYECVCEKQFILSEGYDNSNVVCPYCQSKAVSPVVLLEDEDMLAELGCMTIGFTKNELKKEKINENL